MYLFAESDAHDDGSCCEDDGGEEDGGLAAEPLAEGPRHQREQPCRTHLQVQIHEEGRRERGECCGFSKLEIVSFGLLPTEIIGPSPF